MHEDTFEDHDNPVNPVYMADSTGGPRSAYVVGGSGWASGQGSPACKPKSMR